MNIFASGWDKYVCKSEEDIPLVYFIYIKIYPRPAEH